MNDNRKLLTQEREKLNRLVDEALHKGTPINETHETRQNFKKVKWIAREVLRSEMVLTQSRNVDSLVVLVEGEEKEF